jgi:hypothetical protein
VLPDRVASRIRMLFDVFRLAKAGTANARLAPWRVMHAMLARRLLA